jgi:hypothetical protein
LAAKNIDPLNNGVNMQSIESGPQDWATHCGVCHVGGGQLEYDRNMNDYSASSPSGDRYYFDMPTLAHPSGRLTTVDASPDGFSATNKAELDCLLCHLKTSDPAGSGNGRAWLKSMGCSSSNPMGPLNDPTCSGTSMYPGVPAAGAFTPGTAYDMFNRNLALKTNSFAFAASLGLGATVTGWTPNGNIASVAGVPSMVSGSSIAATPDSSNCSVCHARDDSTAGLPGMMSMKYGYGNFALLSPPGTAQDTDLSVSTAAANDKLWFELGCKTGMGKRAHKIGQGPNAHWGMSLFNSMFGLGKNPGDPVKTETIVPANPMFASMGMTVKTQERMPDADVHDISVVTGQPTGMSCGTCHYTLGSENKFAGRVRNPAYNIMDDLTDANSIFFPAGDHHGVPYPAETVRAIDHQFAQADSYPDTKSKNNLDGTVSCEGCHTTRTHPRLTDNGGTLNSPNPAYAHGNAGFPAFHIEKIACATCHIPEVYAAPGRLKYRDWTAGEYKNGFRNMLDWNFDLITGSHKPVPVLRQWLTKEGEKKIYPVLPSVMPIWVKGSPNSGQDTGSEISGGAYPTTNPMVAPVKQRNTLFAAKQVKDAHPEFDIRLNGGNMVPLFDGFSLSDSWEIDTKPEIDAMTSSTLIVDGSQHATKLKLFQTHFDVTHGVAPKDWALGGTKRGGCKSCHSSKDPYARNAMGMPTGPNPAYSPVSVGFFEGYQQPLDNAAFGIGQYDMLKNWFALFADFDCTMMCGGGMQPDSTYFDPAGNPITDAACGDPMGMGWTKLGQCVDFMASTFDAAMGFPAGTSMMMGMYDGIAGLQGFTVRETVSGLPLGCNPFAGPASMSPFPGMSINNCMPSNNPMFTMGSCVGADPANGMPGRCDANSFRYNGMCMMNSDCNGTTFSAEEYAANQNGLIYSRGEARSHFKIMLQQSGSGATAKVTWPFSVEKNPGNPSHVNSWDQALTSCKDMMGMPTACGDGTFINTTVHANQLLGYEATKLAALMSDPSTISYTIAVTAGANGTITPGDVSVPSGSNATFAITANPGYRVADVLADGVSVGKVTSYTFFAVEANHTISATFEADTFNITASAEANGAVSPAGATAVNKGSNLTVTITPNTGYKVLKLVVDGATLAPATSYTFSNVTANHSITAYFTPIVYTIKASATTGGTITPYGTANVNYGASQNYTIAAALGYHIVDVTVDGASQGAVSSYSFTNVTANHIIAVTFAANPSYTITASAGTGGTISPAGAVSVLGGTNKQFTIRPAVGNKVADVTVDGASIGAVSYYTFVEVGANHTIHATFKLDEYTIEAWADEKCTITPVGSVTVTRGGSQAFTIAPKQGYQILNVIVDNSGKGAITEYTFTNVTGNHSINAFCK